MNLRNEIEKANVISIVGFAKSGKTTVCERLIRRVCQRGATVAAIKTGRTVGHDLSQPGPTDPDGKRLARAGAKPSLFWSESGLIDDETGVRVSAVPLLDTETFASAWREHLPEDTRRELEERDLIIIEGRNVTGAYTVHVRKHDDETGHKYTPQRGDIRIDRPEEIDASIDTILDLIRQEGRDAR